MKYNRWLRYFSEQLTGETVSGMCHKFQTACGMCSIQPVARVYVSFVLNCCNSLKVILGTVLNLDVDGHGGISRSAV